MSFLDRFRFLATKLALSDRAAKLRDDLAGRRAVWRVARYRAREGVEVEPAEFDVRMPVSPDDLIDVHAWGCARERAVVEAPDGARIGRLARRGDRWMVEFAPGMGAADLRLDDDARGDPEDRYYFSYLRREIDPSPPPRLDIRGPGWFVIRYRSDLVDSPLTEFDLIQPADADGRLDVEAWRAARERTIVTRASDGARIGLFMGASNHWVIDFEPGLGPNYGRMGDIVGNGVMTCSDEYGGYAAISFRPLEP
ncbi:hypothetical protein [Caulobacter sp. 17J65-9]|uniref:hypothetical protein n=1 Tax=Caulobacter sp. 17J65-9 TaxID=2709382 RepID=UPI0013C5D90A|nr:hypothetical protein [Caulobacter sp. 17J65-9]NEX92251.1 hypothetical protein [Caulobacter sp. 17J65-9]